MSENIHDAIVRAFDEKHLDHMTADEIAVHLDREDDRDAIAQALEASDHFTEVREELGVTRFWRYDG